MAGLIIRIVLVALIFAMLFYINENGLRNTKWSEFTNPFYLLLFFTLETALAIKISTLI